MIPPAIGIIDAVRAERRDGESLLDAAQRILIYEAMRRSYGVQKDAAELLGITPRIINYRCRELGLTQRNVMPSEFE